MGRHCSHLTLIQKLFLGIFFLSMLTVYKFGLKMHLTILECHSTKHSISINCLNGKYKIKKLNYLLLIS